MTRASHAQPHMDPRHNAMLKAMGVNTWWAEVALPQEPVPVATAVSERRAPMPLAEAAPSVVSSQPARRPAHPGAPAHTAPSAEPVPAAVTQQGVMALPLVDMRTLEDAVRGCSACGLSGKRRHAVPGVGDTDKPDWLVVGEAPGEEEDRQGLPFVGRAGQLLDRMLAAMGLNREDKVYIANVIKCRPPQNRNPEPDEIAQCTPYLLRQVELLQPRMVLAMGRFAAQTLLSQGSGMSADALRQTPLGKLRGRVHTVHVAGRDYPVVVTYHPAYLLRSPGEKAKAWADLCLAMDAVEAPAQP